MQNANARDDAQRQALQELRQWHHEVHLKFVKKIYERQIAQGGHAHLEQPAYALSWRTQALSKLPGHHSVFDMCRYGCECEDVDGRCGDPSRRALASVPPSWLCTGSFFFDANMITNIIVDSKVDPKVWDFALDLPRTTSPASLRFWLPP